MLARASRHRASSSTTVARLDRIETIELYHVALDIRCFKDVGVVRDLHIDCVRPIGPLQPRREVAVASLPHPI